MPACVYTAFLPLPNREGRPGGFPPCARPTRGVRDRALREHRESPGHFFFLYPSSPVLKEGACPLLQAMNGWHPLIAPAKLVRFKFPGMAPVLVPLRPSSKHILIVRAPGARDLHGCHSSPTLYEQEGHLAAPSSFFRERTLRKQERLTGTLPSYA